MGKELTVEEIREKIILEYSANNIIRERSDLYYDFIISLLSVIDETYLGPEAISTQEDMVNHFTWCFKKVVDNFKKEKIKFSPDADYEYLWFFIYKGYYTSTFDGRYGTLVQYFTYLFDYTAIKTPQEIASYIDFYKIFDQNLKKLN